MRRILGTIGPALALLVTGCGATGPPETPASLATGTATTASASAPEPSAGPAGPASRAGPGSSASRPAGSTTAKTTRKPPPPRVPPTTAKPPAKGSPVRTAPIEIIGTSYADLGPVTKAQLADECGGTLCITILETVEGPPDPNLDCKVKRIIQSVPIYRGDTITFVLADPCGGFTEPPPTTE